jgi:putative transposase
MQNGFNESFNGRMHHELLNETPLFNLDQATSKITAWAKDYNLQLPHSSLGYLTPVAFAANLAATGNQLSNTDQLRRSPIATTAPLGGKIRRRSNRRWMTNPLRIRLMKSTAP